MKQLKNIKDIEKISELNNEYDLEKAMLLQRKLKKMSEDKPEYERLREKLLDMIEDYENKNWSDSDQITEKQIGESDAAEKQVDQEQLFIRKRKELIVEKLKEYDMNQKELGELLGHRKSYMSELLNGLSQFSLKDLIIIHRIFGIELKNLVPTTLQNETREKIQRNIMKLNNPKLKQSKKDITI